MVSALLLKHLKVNKLSIDVPVKTSVANAILTAIVSSEYCCNYLEELSINMIDCEAVLLNIPSGLKNLTALRKLSLNSNSLVVAKQGSICNLFELTKNSTKLTQLKLKGFAHLIRDENIKHLLNPALERLEIRYSGSVSEYEYYPGLKYTTGNVFSIIAEMCPNITHLALTRTDLGCCDGSLASNLLALKQLKCLKLIYPTETQDAMNEICTFIRECNVNFLKMKLLKDFPVLYNELKHKKSCANFLPLIASKERSKAGWRNNWVDVPELRCKCAFTVKQENKIYSAIYKELIRNEIYTDCRAKMMDVFNSVIALHQHSYADCCKAIKPNLYIGKIEKFENKPEYGYIIDASNTGCVRNKKNTFYVPVHDKSSANISLYFRKVISLISRNTGQKKVAVCCEAGISRSATLVLAYLIDQYRMSLQEAYEFLQLRRNKIRPCPKFLQQLACFAQTRLNVGFTSYI
ncbi:Dual specificity protein phosphatase 14-like protein [Leptotrombidium deliense]|uniref:protein-tyrosine-phosphatase n=1 Tax=Leptotrombidium deliense TaxID=299467 RepID=A0A443SDH6_9ACAR|nr:Dual specificity protein phosphatase 14-like protein [Leptotrombidium deliense]